MEKLAMPAACFGLRLVVITITKVVMLHFQQVPGLRCLFGKNLLLLSYALGNQH